MMLVKRAIPEILALRSPDETAAPTATDETNPSIGDLISDVRAIKCAIMAYQEGQGHGGHIDAAYRSMDEAWGHLMLIQATGSVAP
jgi:hypothetical protein